jgi:hypothetical protein
MALTPRYILIQISYALGLSKNYARSAMLSHDVATRITSDGTVLSASAKLHPGVVLGRFVAYSLRTQRPFWRQHRLGP